MYIHVVPLDQQLRNGQIYRGPMYLRWRFGTGYDWRWTLNDFGNEIPIALVTTSKRLPVRDENLRSYGIETKWIERAECPRERIHRTLGMALAMQAGVDRPDLWLGRDIHFGNVGTLPAFDQRMYAFEQEVLKQQIIEPLRVQWERKHPKFDWRAVLKQMALMPLAVLMAALPATDAFTGANGTALTTYSASWTANNGAFAINTNAVYSNSSSTETGAHWNADSFNDAQYAQITVKAIGSASLIGIAVRAALSAASWVEYYGDSTASYLAKMVTSTWTQKGSDGGAFATSHLYRLEGSGTTFTPKDNSSVAGIGAQTDASLTSGYAGIAGYAASSSTRGDDWEGGNLAGAAATSLLLDRGRRFQDLLVR